MDNRLNLRVKTAGLWHDRHYKHDCHHRHDRLDMHDRLNLRVKPAGLMAVEFSPPGISAGIFPAKRLFKKISNNAGSISLVVAAISLNTIPHAETRKRGRNTE